MSPYQNESSLLIDSFADRALGNAIANERLASALLFFGPDGVGKWLGALSLAAYLNCAKRDDSGDEPKTVFGGFCGECPACRQIFSGTFPDLHLVFPTPTAKSQKERNEFDSQFLLTKNENPLNAVRWPGNSGISIDRARAVKSKLSRKPNPGAYRVVLFYQVEKMLAQAVDSLLRMIEEPPENTLFILSSSRPEAVIETARSRCQRLRFPTQSIERISSYLQDSVGLNASRAETVSRLAQGSPGRALEIANEMEAPQDDKALSREVGWLTLKAVFLESGPSALQILSRSVDLRNRSAVETLISMWEDYLRDLILIQQGLPAQVANVDLAGDMQKLAPAVQAGPALYALFDKFTTSRVNLRQHVNAQLALTDLSMAIREVARR